MCGSRRPGAQRPQRAQAQASSDGISVSALLMMLSGMAGSSGVLPEHVQPALEENPDCVVEEVDEDGIAVQKNKEEEKKEEEEEKKWRASLKVGDMVDAAFDGSMWLIAQISEVKEDADEIEVIFMELGDRYNKWLDRYDCTVIAHPNTNSKKKRKPAPRTLFSSMSGLNLPPLREMPRDEPETKEEKQWRSELEVGSEVDCLDQQGQWYISEIKDEREVKGKKEFYIKFSEWTERWNIWVKQSSNNMRRPHTKSKPRSEQSGLASLSLLNALTSAMPDYTDITADITPGCINSTPEPALIKQGRFLRISMPGDNSCMFHSITYLCESQAERTRNSVLTQRLRIAKFILAHGDVYSEIVLGMTPERYVNRLKRLHVWGGAIELGIFSQIFEVQVVAIDVKTCTVYTFPNSDDHKYTKRVFTVYHHNHYDVLSFMENGSKRLQECFSAKDSKALDLAIKHAELLHMACSGHFETQETMEWKGLGALEASLTKPLLARQLSETAAQMFSVSKVPALRRAKSEEVTSHSSPSNHGQKEKESSKEAP